MPGHHGQREDPDHSPPVGVFAVPAPGSLRLPDDVPLITQRPGGTMRTRTIATIAAGLLLATLTACGSSDDGKPADPKKLDDAASLACDDFANGYKAALTSTARVDLANKVNKWAQDSGTNGIADNGKALARGSEGSATAWKMGADAFAQACLDAGWKR